LRVKTGYLFRWQTAQKTRVSKWKHATGARRRSEIFCYFFFRSYAQHLNHRIAAQAIYALLLISVRCAEEMM